MTANQWVLSYGWLTLVCSSCAADLSNSDPLENGDIAVEAPAEALSNGRGRAPIEWAICPEDCHTAS